MEKGGKEGEERYRKRKKKDIKIYLPLKNPNRLYSNNPD